MEEGGRGEWSGAVGWWGQCERSEQGTSGESQGKRKGEGGRQV